MFSGFFHERTWRRLLLQAPKNAFLQSFSEKEAGTARALCEICKKACQRHGM